MEKTKICTKCKYEMPIDDFYCLGNDPDRAMSWCKSCMSKIGVSYAKKRNDKRKALGVCRSCGKPTMTHSTNFCELHYIASTIKNALGKTSKKLAGEMLKRLENQNYRCPYTGEKLVLGVNAQIDHIMPRSRFPELASDIKNIEWVSEIANHAKWQMTKEEFLAKYILMLR